MIKITKIHKRDAYCHNEILIGKTGKVEEVEISKFPGYVSCGFYLDNPPKNWDNYYFFAYVMPEDSEQE